MQHASSRRDDRLEEQSQLAALDRAVQLVLGRMASERTCSHRVVEHLDASAPELLGVVHRGVGVAEQLVRGLVTAFGDRDANAQSDERLGVAHDERLRDRRAESLPDLDRALARRTRAAGPRTGS